MAASAFRRRVAGVIYRTLRWGRERLPPGVRTIVGILFMIGGVFGFLPILGFWMFPLGAAFIALDVPFARRRLDRWMAELRRQSGNAVTVERPLADNGAAGSDRGR